MLNWKDVIEIVLECIVGLGIVFILGYLAWWKTNGKYRKGAKP